MVYNKQVTKVKVYVKEEENMADVSNQLDAIIKDWTTSICPDGARFAVPPVAIKHIHAGEKETLINLTLRNQGLDKINLIINCVLSIYASWIVEQHIFQFIREWKLSDLKSFQWYESMLHLLLGIEKRDIHTQRDFSEELAFKRRNYEQEWISKTLR